jgi:hypothetical protein
MMPNFPLNMLRAVAVALLASQLLFSQASPRTYTYKGRTIRYTVAAFNPPVEITPSNGGLNQDTAINCVRLYWSRLQDLDIQAAAQLYVDPQREIDLRTKYRQRVGETVFREMHEKLFESTRFTHELVIGTEHALVSDKNPGFLMLFRVRDGKFFLESPVLEKLTPDAEDLITLVNDYGDGKLKFE